MKNKQNMNIKEKVKLIAGTIEKNDNNDGFNYFENLISFYFANDNDYQIIKEKMNNLIKLLSTFDEKELKNFENLDFETEIWEMI
jgi:hypothetical protein